MHEEHENGKSYLPGSPSLLFWFGFFRRQPMSPISFRRVALWVDHQMEYAGAVGSMAPLPH